MIPDTPDVLALIQRRISTRSYAGRPVEPALLDDLLRSIPLADHLTDSPPRIELITGLERTSGVLTYSLGSYGLLANVPHLLVGVLPGESAAARVDLGYVLEQTILEATRLGLGTCWVTGSYSPQHAGDALELAAGEVIAAVCALGHASETRLGHFHTRAVRRLAGGGGRKPLTEIVFAERWGERWEPMRADPMLVTVLEQAQAAPSAHNGQPWRFIVRREALALALVHHRPIDAGIVMAHVALASAALGRLGRWRLLLGGGAQVKEWGLPKGIEPVGFFA